MTRIDCPGCGHFAHRKNACMGGMGDYCDCPHDKEIPMVENDPLEHTDTQYLDWLDEDNQRLQDVYWHMENEGGTLREAVEFMIKNYKDDEQGPNIE
jgi:hypothetical protein